MCQSRQVNIAGLSLQDAAEFASNLAMAAPRVQVLRLKVHHQTGWPSKFSSGQRHSDAALQVRRGCQVKLQRGAGVT